MSQDRPTFVLPWIVVVLAAFAFLPPWMGRLLDEGAPSPLTDTEPLHAREDAAPPVLEGPLALPAMFEEAQMLELEATPQLASASKVEGETEVETPPATLGTESVEPVEAGLTSALEATERPTEQGSGEPRELQSIAPTAFLAGGASVSRESDAIATATVARLTRSSSMQSSAPLSAEAEVLRERIRVRQDGKVELRLSPATVSFLIDQELIPADLRLEQVPVERLVRELESKPGIRSAVKEKLEDVESRRKKRARAFLRLARSNPRKAASLLAVLEPRQLFDLWKRVEAHGMNPNALFSR